MVRTKFSSYRTKFSSRMAQGTKF
eukprot:SAG11_NODE_18858_length_479_cov_4.231579_1_plen_23_part_10